MPSKILLQNVHTHILVYVQTTASRAQHTCSHIDCGKWQQQQPADKLAYGAIRRNFVVDIDKCRSVIVNRHVKLKIMQKLIAKNNKRSGMLPFEVYLQQCNNDCCCYACQRLRLMSCENTKHNK